MLRDSTLSATEIRIRLQSPPVDLPATEPPWPEAGCWTYQDYLRLPDDGRRYEIIRGVLHVSPAPRFIHQFAVQALLRKLGDFVEIHGPGIVLPAPFEVFLSETDRPLQPDVVVIGAEHHLADDASAFEGIPSLVVEVLSPSTIRTDRVTKFALYEEAGVAEYWIVDPRLREVEVYTLDGALYRLHGQFVEDQEVTSVLFAGITFPAESLFP
jgi:Uma2 family endonuclease